MSCGIAWQARHGASSSPAVANGFPAYISQPAARLLIGVSAFREPADRNALLFQVGEEGSEAAPGPSSQDPLPPYRAPANLAELVSECEATSLLIVPRVPRGLGRGGTEIPPVFVDRRIASALHKDLAAKGRGDEVVQAHERAAEYWQWRAAAWPQDQEADLHDLLEARHHRHEAGDDRQAGVLTEIACAQLHAWGELDREAALIQEILAWLPARSPLRATWIQEIGKIAQARGNYAEAERRYQQSLDIFASVGDTPAVSRSYHHLGVLAQAQGDYGEAERRYRQSGNVTGPAVLVPGSTGRAKPDRGGSPGPGGPLTARPDSVTPARQVVRATQQIKQGQAARLSQQAQAAQIAQSSQPHRDDQPTLSDKPAQSATSAPVTPTAVRKNQPAQMSQATRTAPARRAGHPGLPTRTGRAGHLGRAGRRVRAGQPDLLPNPEPLVSPDLWTKPTQPGQATQAAQSAQAIQAAQAAQPSPPVMLNRPAWSGLDGGSGPQVWLGQQGNLEPQAAVSLAGGAGQLGIPGKITAPVRNPGAGPATRNPPGLSGPTSPAGSRRIRHAAGHTASPAPSSGRMLWAAMGTAAVLAAVIVGTITGFLPGGEQPGQSGTSEPAGSSRVALAASPAALAAAARGQAAQWARDQLSSGTLISCDPAMCAALRAHHYPAAQLVQLNPGAPDPLGADVVMATAAVRSQFGRRLATVYAPGVEVAIGTGKARIQVRVIPPDGAAAYPRELRADLRHRRVFGAALLGNTAISAPAGARHQLAAGLVDARLLNALTFLASTHPLHIVGFTGAGPGASPGIPLRTVEITGAAPAGGPALTAGANDRFLHSALMFLRAQRPPYLALKTQLIRRHGQPDLVRFEFGAPSPLGLLASGTAETGTQP